MAKNIPENMKVSAFYGETDETIAANPGNREEVYTAADGVRADLLGTDGNAVVRFYRATTISKAARDTANAADLASAEADKALTAPAREEVRKGFADCRRMMTAHSILKSLNPAREIIRIPARA
jgi:hypothetical protein